MRLLILITIVTTWSLQTAVAQESTEETKAPAAAAETAEAPAETAAEAPAAEAPAAEAPAAPETAAPVEDAAPTKSTDSDEEPEFADYTVLVGGSPFGGSITFAVNQSRRTTYQFTLGGLPQTTLSDQKIGDITYDIDSNSSWVGAFVSHRPFMSMDWFRLMAGVGFGRIQNELYDDRGNIYTAHYTENPVGYLGLGFGANTDRGFQWAFDIGWLQTGGPKVEQKSGPDKIQGVLDDISNHWMFGSALPNAQFSIGWGF
ncbi:MAG: hypothetical protein ACPGQS_14175 [Bradymonadia bacterium]